MALDFSKFKFNFFARLNARTRVLVLLGGVVAVLLLVYLGTRWLVGEESTTGPSRVANAPQELQTVPGAQQTAEYQRALEQASVQRAQQAQLSGASAIATQINVGTTPSPGGCVICAEQTANVKHYLEDWVRQGQVAPEVAAELQRMADKNVSVDDYAAELSQLVKQGKLTPEQARILLEQYKKQHANALLQENAKAMDALIQSGKLPLGVANELLLAQKNEMPLSAYAVKLQEKVQQGLISPDISQQLLGQYTQQKIREVTMQSIAGLKQMAREGRITPDVEKDLIQLEENMVPLDTYEAALNQYVSAGKLTPASADIILNEYKRQKAAVGPTGSIDQLVKQAETAAYGEINELLSANKITSDVAEVLRSMIQKNISLDAFKLGVSQLVQQNKLTPDIAKLKIADYTLLKGRRDMALSLAKLQANNASAQSYSDSLKNAVQSGLLTPEQAAQLMKEYQAITQKATVLPGLAAPVPGAEEFAKLQAGLQGTTAAVSPPTPEFAAAEVQKEQDLEKDRQARIEALMTSMSSQSQQLVAAWQPSTMLHRAGSAETAKSAEGDGKGAGTGARGGKEAAAAELGGPTLIKAGSILFAVLDTEVNSDYPDSPVMATIVAGKFKGAKLLGKLITTKSVSGQLDRVALNFSLMNKDEWDKSKGVTAYAIDPDKARTVLASHVDYHYLQRFGAMFATSFMQGYSSAVTNAGTSTTGIFGTSTTHNNLSPGNKIAVALGQVGQTIGNATQNYINRPPTVKVDSGVGLGILFMSDVTG